ncbi:MAG: FAD-dependent tricarballylate dehydrogenase TcuA [Pseudomonadota bacterium]
MSDPLSRDWDVLVAGGGNAALCAAITARRAGARVLVLEAAPKFYRGGNTRHTRNCRLAHDEPNEVLTGPYPEAELWEDLLRVTGGKTDEQLALFMISESKGLWEYLHSLGVRFQPSLTGSLSLGRTNAFFLGGGRSMLNALYRTAAAEGVEVLYEAEVTGVAIEDGAFRSATVTRDGEAHELRARAFVAASGGFEANIEWLEESWGEAARNFRIRGTPYNRGSLLRAMLDAGCAQVGEADQCHAVALDARAPRFDGGIATRLDCIPFGIVVNREGARFYDEGEDFWPKRYAIWGRLVAAQPGQIAHAIIDAKSAELFMPSIFPPVEADSLDELAGKLELDAQTLRGTVDAFNAAVEPGDFDPAALDGCRTRGLSPEKTNWARRIEEPPFFAYPLRPGITFTYLGLRVDREARVAMAGGGRSENIYAAGEIMAGNVLGQGYLAGIGMTIGSVFGRIAGREAAKHGEGADGLR